MKITIKKIGTQILTGNASGVVNTYMVNENGREFFITRTSRIHGSYIGIAGEEGILYVDNDDNKVHRQVVALAGACGLNTDDEVVEQISPWALKGVIVADLRNEPEEITIISKVPGNSLDQPLVFVDGKALESVEHKNVNRQLSIIQKPDIT